MLQARVIAGFDKPASYFSLNISRTLHMDNFSWVKVTVRVCLPPLCDDGGQYTR
jgi:hypothetical protein